jgi:hypothetical protein
MTCTKGSQCDFLHCYVHDPRSSRRPLEKRDLCAYFRTENCRKLNTCKFVHACTEAEIPAVCTRHMGMCMGMGL